MPHRRKPRKGSFAGHFDELVRHFPADEEAGKPEERRDRTEDEHRSVHDRLFDRAWRKQDEERCPPS